MRPTLRRNIDWDCLTSSSVIASGPTASGSTVALHVGICGVWMLSGKLVASYELVEDGNLS